VLEIQREREREREREGGKALRERITAELRRIFRHRLFMITIIPDGFRALY
jgi:5-carboxymethyl-2-hydroxymuconate isomerase